MPIQVSIRCYHGCNVCSHTFTIFYAFIILTRLFWSGLARTSTVLQEGIDWELPPGGYKKP